MESRAGSEAGGPSGTGPTVYAADDVERAARWDRITAIAGLLFVVLVVASFFTPDTPDSGGSAEELAAAISDDRAGHQMSLLLGFLADIAFLLFLAGVWSRFRRYEGSGGMMASLFVVAGTAFAATILVSEGLYLAYVQAAESADPSVLPTIAALDDWVGIGTVPAGVAMMIGATGAILSTHALPAWLGWLAGLNAVLLVLSLGAVFETDDESVLAGVGFFGGFLGLLIWVLATGVVLLMRPRHHAEAVA
jgi:hypothetical protein